MNYEAGTIFHCRPSFHCICSRFPPRSQTWLYIPVIWSHTMTQQFEQTLPAKKKAKKLMSFPSEARENLLLWLSYIKEGSTAVFS